MAKIHTVDDSLNRLRKLANTKGWSKGKMADLAGFGTRSITHKMMSPDWNPNVETVRRLEAIVPKNFK